MFRYSISEGIVDYVIIFSDVALENVTKLQRSAFLDFVFENLLHSLVSWRALLTLNFIVEIFQLYVFIFSSIYYDLYFDGESFDVFECMPTKNDEHDTEHDRHENAE